MVPDFPFPVKKTFLYSLIGSVVVSASLGVLTIISGRFGWVEIRVILTTATIAIASVSGLACGAHLGTKTNRAVPLAGIALTLLAAMMVIGGMWSEATSTVYWKLAATVSVFAVACAHLSLLSMARLAEWFRWSLVAAYIVILGVALLISSIVWFEISEAGMFRLLGVAAIVDAAITVLVPILHRLSPAEGAAAESAHQGVDAPAIDAEIERLRQRIAELERMKGPGASSR